jgi:hypothetical protein
MIAGTTDRDTTDSTDTNTRAPLQMLIMLRLSCWGSRLAAATRLQNNRQKNRVRFPAGKEIFLSATSLRRALVSNQSPSQLKTGTVPKGIAPGWQAKNSPPTSAEIKNALSYISTPPYAFMEHRDNFIILLLTGLWGVFLKRETVTLRA